MFDYRRLKEDTEGFSWARHRTHATVLMDFSYPTDMGDTWESLWLFQWLFFFKGRCWWTIGIFGGPHFCYHTCTCGNHMWQHDLTIFDILTTSWLIRNTWGSNKRLFLLILWYPAIPMPNNWLLFILCAKFRWWHPNIELVRILFVGCKSLLLPHRII